MRKELLGILLLVQSLHLFGQDTVRIASYNLLNYPGSNSATRNPFFRTVVTSMNPDVLAVQEMTSQEGMDEFLEQIVNYHTPGMYSAVPFHDGPDTDNGFFFSAQQWELVGARYIPTTLRDFAEYTLRHKKSGEQLRIYSIHLKAGIGSEQQRLEEATILREHLNNLPSGTAFVILGDYNIYTSTEPAFQRLIGSEADDKGRAFDPLTLVGDWHDGIDFAPHHTQSPRVRAFDGGVGGGLDDRFDMILTSASALSRIIASSYKAYGNDGNHFNDSINRLPDSAVPDSIAVALHDASDHLPVVADFIFPSSPAGVAQAEKLPREFVLCQNFPNPFNPSTTIRYGLSSTTKVLLVVYDVLGQVVATLVDETQSAGYHEVRFNGSGLSSGMYLYRLTTGSCTQAKVSVIVR